MQLTLKMKKSGRVTGTAKTRSPMDDSELFGEVKGTVSGEDLSLEVTFAVGGFSVKLELDGEIDGDAIEGDSTINMPGNREESKFEAARLPDSGGSQ